jgi:hypothetical protein
MKTATIALVFTVMFGVAVAAASYRRDPLTATEANQLRETAQLPLKRLALMLGFAKQRLDGVEELRAGKPAADRGRKIQGLLEEFGDVVDELNQNIDTYADRHDDLRKVLKIIAEGSTQFQSKLQALEQASSEEEVKDYKVTLSNAVDSAKALTDNATKTLEEQEVLAKNKQLKKP